MLTEEQKQQILNSPNFKALINKPTQPTNTGSSFVDEQDRLREQATPPVAPTLPTQKKKLGFFDVLKETGGDIFQAVKGAGEAVETRAKNIGEDVKEVVSGDVNPVRGILRSAGEVGGLFQDIAGEVYGGVARALVSQNTEDKVKEIMKDSEVENREEAISNIVGAVLKYGMLKSNVSQDVAFDMEESISMLGDSGPIFYYILWLV